jgi:hypothetical protein
LIAQAKINELLLTKDYHGMGERAAEKKSIDKLRSASHGPNFAETTWDTHHIRPCTRPSIGEARTHPDNGILV